MDELHYDHINGVEEMISLEERRLMESRMLGFIFPNTPVKKFEKDAFDLAVKYQIMHEREKKKMFDAYDLPDNVASFTIGSFSMSFAGAREGSDRLTRKTVCDASYSILLRAGLLYKGVERGYCYGLD